MKRTHQSNAIQIDRLPKELVGNVLKRLPIQDAVKTSILSRKWRYAWTELPKLVFDDNFCDDWIMAVKSKLIMAIYQVLFLHHGHLNKFKLSVSSLESDCPEIDQFVLIVLKKGVKDLRLHFRNDKPYKLPSSVFAYGQQLEYLHLHSCVFKPPSGFNGFSKLDSLLLYEVGISGSRFSRIISHCPLLRWLCFKSSTSGDRIDIIGPNLKYVRIECLCLPLCFENTPKLETVKIYSSIVEYDTLKEIQASGESMLCGSLPVIEELTLDNVYMQHVTSIRTSSLVIEDPCRVKTLSLFGVCFGITDDANDVFAALCLIRNFPKLEKFNVDVYTDITASEIDFTEAEDVSLDHLKKVELRQVSGSKCELQFIRFILAKSSLLEKLIVVPDSNYLCGEKRFEFFKELLRFRHASPLLEIAYEG